MHEVLTVQIGEQANYLGTHFWNVQESYFTYDDRQESPVDHNVHFQAGIGADGSDTFTPRTLIYDFKRNFGTLRKVNELYDALGQDDGDRPTSSATTHRQAQIPLHPYQLALNEGNDPPQLDPQNVRFWSDYNRVFYHPRSIAQVYEDQLEPQQRAFASWQDGEALFNALSRHTDLFDDELRPLIEQCDQMQGIQMITGVDDGWGGFAARYLDGLRDDYEKATIVVSGMSGTPPDSLAKTRRTLSTANQARSLFALSQQASVYIPFSAAMHPIPSVFAVSSKHPWYTSAAQTIGFESTFLQTRLRGSSIRFAEVAQVLTSEPGQRIAEAEFQVLGANEYAPNGMNGHEESDSEQALETCRLQPHVEEQAHSLDGVIEVVRGRDAKGYAANEDEGDSEPGQSLRSQSELPFPVLDSFPAVNEGAKSFRVRARLGKSSSVAAWAAALQTVAARAVGVEHREEVLDGLSQIKAAYKSDFLSDESEEDD